MQMRNVNRFEKYYFSRPWFVDGTTEFHRLIANYVTPGSTVLEIGAGPSNTTSKYLGSTYELSGIDISDEVRTNSALKTSHTYDGGLFPLPDCAFDACVSNYVLEHVADPVCHFAEVRRILRSGGVYVFRTPNVLHYVTLASRLLPHGLHGIANRVRGLSEEAHDPYPTSYRANSLTEIKRLASQAELVPEHVALVEKEPSYGKSSAALFYPMMVYERVVNSSELFSALRANIFAVLRKQ